MSQQNVKATVIGQPVYVYDSQQAAYSANPTATPLIAQSEPQVTYIYGYKVEKKKARCGGGVLCCLCCCSIFLILFFLIPRPPHATYESTEVTFNPYTVSQTYKVYNGNMYSLSLENFDMQVKMKSDESMVGYGTLKGNDTTFVVPRASNREMTLIYYFNATQAEITQANLQCFSDDGVTYKTTGTVEMKTWQADFHDVDLGPWTNTYYCN